MVKPLREAVKGLESVPLERAKVTDNAFRLVKTWRKRTPADQLKPKWKGSFSVILATSTAVAVEDIDNWSHPCRLKLVPH